MPSRTPSRDRRRSGPGRAAKLLSRRWIHVLACVLPILGLLIAMALLLPLASAPDEQAHYLYSAAVVRGQVGTLDVDVPAGVNHVNQYLCMWYDRSAAASCQLPFTGPNPDVAAQTHVGLYNPVFYAWTGLATLAWPDVDGLYGARILAAIVTATVLGWTISFLRRTARSVWPLVGVALATTPMVTYMGAVLNPSAWEIVAALGAVVAAWAVFVNRDTPSGRWTEGHSLLLVSGSVLLVSRGLSPLVAGLIFVALAICAGWSRMRSGLTSRPNLVVLAVLTVVGVYAVLWTVAVGTNYVAVSPPPSIGAGLKTVPTYFTNIFLQVEQYFGLLSPDLRPSAFLVVVWACLLIGFVTVSFAFARPRMQLVIAAGALVVLLLPATLQGIEWNGAGWQGRYTLPMVVAVVAIAALAASETELPRTAVPDFRAMRRRAQVGAAVCFVVFQTWTLVLATRRNMVGNDRSLTDSAIWTPPGGMVLLLVIAIACILAIGLSVGRAPARRAGHAVLEASERPVVRT